MTKECVECKLNEEYKDKIVEVYKDICLLIDAGFIPQDLLDECIDVIIADWLERRRLVRELEEPEYAYIGDEDD